MVQLSFVFSKKMTSIKPKKTVLNIDEEAEGRHFQNFTSRFLIILLLLGRPSKKTTLDSYPPTKKWDILYLFSHLMCPVKNVSQ